MKKALSLLAVFLVTVMWSTSGFSADKYASGNIGISWFDSSSEKSQVSVPGQPDQVNRWGYGKGITLTGAVGCDYGDYRIEAELGYQTNDMETITAVASGPQAPPAEEYGGDVSILSLMGNGYYDIDLGGVELFVGGGVGVAQIDFDDIEAHTQQGQPVASPTPVDNYSETTFAYQLGAGLGVPVADNVTVELEYRYFATTDFTINRGVASPTETNADGSPVVNNTNFNFDIKSHSALLGLRVNL